MSSSFAAIHRWAVLVLLATILQSAGAFPSAATPAQGPAFVSPLTAPSTLP